MTAPPRARRVTRLIALIGLAAVLFSALPSPIVGVAGAGEDPPAAEGEPSVDTEADRSGTWVGRVDGTEVAVALVTNGKKVWAYACDGASTSAFFRGDLVGNSFLVAADNGATISGAFQEGDAQGTFTSPDGSITGAFTAKRPVAGGGLFVSDFNTEDGSKIALRWIVADDGTQRGNAETTAAGQTAVTPAPPLDVPAAQDLGTVPLDVAGGPVPVNQINPQSLSGPVPTSTAPPPPLPPPNPPLQPLTVAAKVDPGKAEIGAPVRYQLTLTNPNKAEAKGAGVGVGFPPGLTFQPTTEKTNCKGRFVAFPPGATRPGDPQLVLSDVTLGPGASCTADVAVVASAAVAVDVVTNPPTAQGAPPGAPAKARFVIGSTAVAPGPTTTTTNPRQPTTTTTKPPATTTTRPSGTTTTRPPDTTTSTTTTTTRPPTTTTTASTTTTGGATTATAPPGPRRPSAPRNLRAKVLSVRPEDNLTGRVELTFDPPSDNGGARVTGFFAGCHLASDDAVFVEAEGRSSPLPLTGLRLNEPYECAVAAENAVGLGPDATVAVTVAGPRRPSAPRNLRAKVLSVRPEDNLTGRVELTFDPPSDNGGARVTGFFAGCHLASDDAVFVEAEGRSSPLPLTGLRLDEPYECAVAAENAVGLGPDGVVIVTVPRPKPSAPRDVKAKPLLLRRGDDPDFGGRAEFSFGAPERNGGSRIREFVVECRSTQIIQSGPMMGFVGPPIRYANRGTSSPITVTGLAIETDIRCDVFAINEAGVLGESASIRVEVPLEVEEIPRPSVPRDVKAKPLLLRRGDDPNFGGRAEFSFKPPERNGGSEIREFVVECRSTQIIQSGPMMGFVGPPIRYANRGTSSPITVTGLAIETDIRCDVFAINEAGVPGESAFLGVKVALEVEETPRPPTPSAPRDVKAKPLLLRRGDDPDFGGRAEFSFAAPERNGGSEIREFVVECRSTQIIQSGPMTGFVGPPIRYANRGTSSPITVTGLAIETDIRCDVFAINEAGVRGESASIRVEVPLKVEEIPAPSAPRDLKAKPLVVRQGDDPFLGGRVELSFQVPERNGGSPIREFVAECSSFILVPGGRIEGGIDLHSSRNSEPSSPITVPNLEVDDEVNCRVFAINEAGAIGESADIRDIVIVTNLPPSEPRDVRAKPLPLGAQDGTNSGQVQVSFFPPARNGGAQFFAFEATCGADAQQSTASGDASPVTVKGLPVDVPLTCTVTAINRAGNRGLVSAEVIVTVASVPPAPKKVTAKALPLRPGDGPDDGRVELSFLAIPDDRHPPLTFIPHCAPVDNPESIFTGDIVQGSRSPITLTGLPVDVELQCRVFARSPALGGRDSVEVFAEKTVTVEGVVMLLATPGSGSSPLPVNFVLRHPPKGIERWVIDFGDGTRKVEGRGEVPAVPHTYVNQGAQPITPTAAIRVQPADGEEIVLSLEMEVHPAGTLLTLDGKPSPATVRRGADGAIALTVRNPNPTPVPGPLTVAVPPSLARLASDDWACVEGACAIDAGLESFATAPPLSATFTAPADAPATFEVPFELTAGDSVSVRRSVRVPVVGVLANAGSDQVVDAVGPAPDGSLVPTRVLLDGGDSLGLEGDNVTFSWRKVSGPRVDLDTSSDPTGRIATFEAPSVTGETRIEFELTVSEAGNRSTASTDRMTVTVFPRNQPPVLDRINVSGLTVRQRKETGEFVPEGEGQLQLRPAASDPDGDKLTTSWRVLTPGVANDKPNADTFTLKWPVLGVPQVIVEATVNDPRGAVDSATVTIGVQPDPLGLEATAPARVAAGEQFTARANPSRTRGVDVRWSVVSGTAPQGFPKTGRNISLTAPDVGITEVVTLEVTATETATGASATRELAFEVQAGAPLTLSVPPAVSVDGGEEASIEATVDGPGNRTFEWTQTFGPDVELENADSRTVRFDAPEQSTAIGLRLAVNAGGSTVTANTVVTVGDAAAAPASGCGEDSAYQQFVDGAAVVLGGIAVLTGFTVEGANPDCEEAVLDGVDLIAGNGLVVGDDLAGTVDQDGVELTGGAVRLPDAFRLPEINLTAAPIRIAFDGGGDGGGAPGPQGGGGEPCINWDVAFSSAQFPFVPLPPGFTGVGGSVAITCTSASLNAQAAADGATFAVDGTITTEGGADVTATLTNVPVLGGQASGTGSITVAPGGATTYDLSATITNPSLPIPGLTINTATARLTPAGLTIAADGSLGQGSGSLAVSMEGSFTNAGLSLAVEATNQAPWEVGPGLSVQAANLVGTVDIDAAGAAIVDLRLSVGGDWRPVPGLRVTGLSLQVANTAVPPECAIPAGGVWVAIGGQGAIDIPGVAPILLGVDACLGVPTGGGAPPFSLRSTIGGAPWPIAPGVVIRDVAIEVNLVGGALTLEASGGATLLGLDLTARVLFLLPSGGGQPTVVVDAAGDLTGIGIPIPEAHVVFASAAVPDFEVAPGVTLDLPQGITGVGTIDLGQPIADLLNEAFSPPTPILPTVTVSISFGTVIEIKAAISLGGDGATLFMGCPGGGTSCDPTAPTTTRLALTSAFIRLVLGGSGGFSIGFGADGTLNLPPAEADGSASPPLDLHVEASIQPPARVSLAMFFEGSLENALGLSGLTLSNLGIQGSIDFSTTPIPLVTIGITGQVDSVPDALADVLGLTNNGEPLRFTLNVDPLAPILELTLGVDDGAIVMRPLAAVGQADALEIDFASVVIAPLGGTVGPVTYDIGTISVGFGANILDVPVHVNASVDLASAALNGTVEIGSLTIGGVEFEDTTVLIDITPQRFRQTLCGGVHIGDTTLQGLLHIQAGSGGGGPATCGGVSLNPGSGSPGALRARFRLNAASLPIGPVNVQQLTVDAQAELDALSANFNATLNVTAQINILANNLDIDGTIKFGTTGVKELHVKAIGNVTVGGVQIKGDGTCGFPNTPPTIFSGGLGGAGGKGKSVGFGGPPTSGACVQLDHAPGTSTPFRFGLKGTLTGAGSTASIKGTIDASSVNISGTLNVPTLGNLDVSGTLVFGSGAQIANATGTMVNASVGDWRVSGRFGSNKSLAGGVSAKWDFAAGRVSGGVFVRGSASVSIAGANVSLAGTFSSSGSGNLTYSLTGASSASVDSSVNLNEINVIHTAVRGLFLLPGQRPSDENFVRDGPTRGRLYFNASYAVDVTLSQGGLDIDEANLSARVRYAERFNREGDGVSGFKEESSSRWNTIVNFNVDASGIDEFFEMAVGEAATRTQAAGFCFTVFGQELGACD